jgi:predicted protein tyrosine phosphatase
MVTEHDDLDILVVDSPHCTNEQAEQRSTGHAATDKNESTAQLLIRCCARPACSTAIAMITAFYAEQSKRGFGSAWRTGSERGASKQHF